MTYYLFFQKDIYQYQNREKYTTIPSPSNTKLLLTGKNHDNYHYPQQEEYNRG